MSLKSIIESVAKWAANFIGKVLPSTSNLLKVATGLVNGFKSVDEKHPDIFNAIVAFIPGNVDNYLLDKLREKLPSIMVNLKWAQNETDKTNDQILADEVKYIQLLTSDYRAAMLGSLWIVISNELTENGISIKDLQKLQQTYWEEVGSSLNPPTCGKGEIWNPITKRCEPDYGKK